MKTILFFALMFAGTTANAQYSLWKSHGECEKIEDIQDRIDCLHCLDEGKQWLMHSGKLDCWSKAQVDAHFKSLDKK